MWKSLKYCCPIGIKQDGPGAWAPIIYIGHQNVLAGSWLRLVPDQVAVDIWKVSQKMEDFSLCHFLPLFLFQIKK